jgi:hypothetical protein
MFIFKVSVPLLPIPVQYEFCLGMKKTSLMRILMLCAGSSRRFSDGRLPPQENMEHLYRYSDTLSIKTITYRYLFRFMIREMGTLSEILRYYLSHSLLKVKFRQVLPFKTEHFRLRGVRRKRICLIVRRYNMLQYPTTGTGT